jgi:hypothetical protein
MKVFLGSKDESIFLLFERFFKDQIESGVYDLTYGNYFDNNPYHLIMIDESLQSEIDTKEVPVVIFTSEYRRNIENIFYVHKPISIDEIRKVVQSIYDNINLAEYMESLLMKKSTVLMPMVNAFKKEENYNKIWTNITGKREDTDKIRKMLMNFKRNNPIPDEILEKSQLILEEFISTVLDTSDKFMVGLSNQEEKVVLEIDGIKNQDLFFIKDADFAQLESSNKRNKLLVYWNK